MRGGAPGQRGGAPGSRTAGPGERAAGPGQRNAGPGQRDPRVAPPQQTRRYEQADEPAPAQRRPARAVASHAPTQRPEAYRDDDRGTPPPPALPGRRRKGGAPAPRPRRKRHWGRWILALLLVILLLPIGVGFYVENHLARIDALTNYTGRPTNTPGTNWLLVGSDSRSGLSTEQESELATGGEVGSERTDTIILVHVPESGEPTLVSLPRDSYVTIPGYGKDKLNSAFSFGGPTLLVETVEGATGLRVDHYAQIGFGGFADIVDAVGGIEMCLDDAIEDPLAGLSLRAGCQTLNGAEALGFVRTRATPRADLDRMLNQRKFLSALLKKAASPGTLINPFRSWPLIQGLTKALKVDTSDHVWNLASLGKALAGDPVATTVPIAGFDDTDAGNVLLWDKARASRFFEALAKDEPIPADLVTTVGN
ncbi:LCP family protein [Nocardia sp. NPDC005978]|uniref:LCP family protein n=1 Tax=Nocardia sp. NPDC005978 TaxID=3156725 RepID=UPI0033A37202